MLDDTLAYLTVIAVAFWSNRELKKRNKKEQEELNKKSDEENGLI